MTKVYLISDLHLSNKPSEEYRFAFLTKHFPEIMRRKGEHPDAIVILGDLTQEKDYHAAEFVNRVVSVIHRLSQIAPVITLMGNHDYANEGKVFFEFLKYLPNIYFIDKPLLMLGREVAQPLRKIFAKTLFLPHTRNYERDWEGISMRGWQTIFAHNTFTGADTGAGHKLEGIPLNVFPKANVISGDIHVPQKIGPVTYIGAPYTINFGDRYRARIMRGNPLTGEFNSIYVDAYPQKKVIEISDLIGLKSAKGINAGDLVEIRLQVDSMGDWQTKTEAMLEWCAKKQAHLIRPKPILLEKAVRKNVVVRDTGQSDTDIIRQHSKRHGIEKDVLSMGLEIFGG